MDYIKLKGMAKVKEKVLKPFRAINSMLKHHPVRAFLLLVIIASITTSSFFKVFTYIIDSTGEVSSLVTIIDAYKRDVEHGVSTQWAEDMWHDVESPPLIRDVLRAVISEDRIGITEAKDGFIMKMNLAVSSVGVLMVLSVISAFLAVIAFLRLLISEGFKSKVSHTFKDGGGI